MPNNVTFIESASLLENCRLPTSIGIYFLTTESASGSKGLVLIARENKYG